MKLDQRKSYDHFTAFDRFQIDGLHRPHRKPVPLPIPTEEINYDRFWRGIAWGFALGVPIWIVAAVMFWAAHVRWGL